MAARRAFILAGGVGARLRPQTWVLPKPLLPLGQQTILERLLQGVTEAGIEQATISLGYLGHLVEAVIGDGRRFGLDVSYTREPEPLGTAGALNLLGDVDPDETLLVLNGDTLTTLDLAATMAGFEAGHALAAMVCVERDVVIDFGVVDAAADGRLRGIAEKPRLHHTVSTGINLLRGRALAHLPEGRVDMPDFLLGLVAAGERVDCVVTDALWMDLGRPEDLVRANDLLAEGEVL